MIAILICSTILQADLSADEKEFGSASCGPTALFAAFAKLGIDERLDTLSTRLGYEAFGGITFSDIKSVASSYENLSCSFHDLTFDQLSLANNSSTAVIVSLATSNESIRHAAYLHEHRLREVVILDKTQALSSIHSDEFVNKWDGKALVLVSKTAAMNSFAVTVLMVLSFGFTFAAVSGRLVHRVSERDTVPTALVSILAFAVGGAVGYGLDSTTSLQRSPISSVKPPATRPDSISRNVVESATLNFGRVVDESEQFTDWVIDNPFGEPVRVDYKSVSCSCVSVVECPEIIGIDGDTVVIRYKPNRLPGLVSQSIRIGEKTESGAPGRTFMVGISAYREGISVYPSQFSSASAFAGESIDSEIVVSVFGLEELHDPELLMDTGPLEIASVKLDSDKDSEGVLVRKLSLNLQISDTATIGAAEGTLKLRFAPNPHSQMPLLHDVLLCQSEIVSRLPISPKSITLVTRGDEHKQSVSVSVSNLLDDEQIGASVVPPNSSITTTVEYLVRDGVRLARVKVQCAGKPDHESYFGKLNLKSDIRGLVAAAPIRLISVD